MRRNTVVCSLVAASVLLTACGTQVSDSRRRALAQAQLTGATTGGGGTGGDSSGTPTSGTATSGTTSTGSTGGTSGSTSGSSGSTSGITSGTSSGTSTTGTSGTSSSTSTTGQALPPGGNGGATDVGVTATSILLGNVSDISGPQPGLFKSAVAGTNAYIAYVNSTGGLFGRQLKISVADSATSCQGDTDGHSSLVGKVFAFAGSFSLFDQCGAAVLKQHENVPDAHLAVTPDANGLPNNYSVNPVGSKINNGPYAWATKKFGATVVQHVGFMYANLPAVTNVAALQEKSAKTVGWAFPYTRAVGATETDFTADIIQMKRKGIKVFYTLFDADEMAEFKQQADQQSFKPVMIAPLIYDQTFFQKLGGSAAAQGIYGYNGATLFFSAADKDIPSVALFQKWYGQVAAGQAADTFAADAWAETALLVQAMRAAGPKLTRAKVLAELAKVTSFDADGFFAPANPAKKIPGNCYVIWEIQNGSYVRLDSPAKDFRCDGKPA